ncbi:MAG: Holliday junction branch migration protein RuvA [Lachnospiraceae bacterium]|nr:Holliday junction branch migration protein RuvA [Lachnospiraceae bacterium]
MIAFVSGILEQITEDSAVIDTGGIGYEVTVSQDVISRLPSVGDEVKLYTHFQVTQDAFRLYGFLSRDDLAIFKRLITVSGLGPKGGQAILSVLTPDELRFAILSGNVKAITAAPGIGKKIAERVILELKDRFSDDELTGGITTGGDAARIPLSEDDPGKEAVEALVALGYNAQEAMRAVRSAAGGQEGLDVENLLKAALKELM